MDKYPKASTKKCTKKILSQMEDSIYQIYGKEMVFDIGFFCKIKIEKTNITVFITTYKIIKENNIIQKDKIKISINGEFKYIELGKKKYGNEKYDLVIFEIIENKNDKIKYLELDEVLYERIPEIYYNKESLYILQYNDKNEILVSYGIINDIYESQIKFSCNINSKANGAPIFNLINNKLIGIYKNKFDNYNIAVFFKFIIDEFINIFKTNNEINIKIKVDNNDIGNKIYFLDNYEYEDKQGLKHSHCNLKELNMFNSELRINGEKTEYKKYFIPKREEIYTINLKFNINLTDCSYMFAGCENIVNINFISFITKDVTNMKYMFYNCYKMKNINLYSFQTTNVRDMSGMFKDCNNLEYLDLTSFDTKNVINMSEMFYDCDYLYNLDLSSFNIKNVNNMSYMFNDCNNINTLNLSSFNTKNVNDMSYMFNNCYSLNNLDLASFNTKNVNNMNYMFNNCSNLNYLDLSSFDTLKVTDMRCMFNDCSNLKKLNLNSFDIKNVINIDNIFLGCNNLKFIYSKFLNKNEIQIIIKVKNEDINKKIYFLDNSDEHRYLKELNELNTVIYINDEKSKYNKFFIPEKEGKYIINLIFNIFLTDCSYMFKGCEKIKKINFISFTTKYITNMQCMFSKCKNLKDLDLSSFNTKNVNNMSSMFSDCLKLNNLDLSFFNTENVTNMSWLFSGSNINNLDISSFNTKSVINLSGMFAYCKSLNYLNLSSFNTKNVLDMSHMFYQCNNLKSINLSTFNTSKVINMEKMFYDCKSLNNLNLSNFDSKNVLNAKNIFHGCKQFIIDSNLPIFQKFETKTLI